MYSVVYDAPAVRAGSPLGLSIIAAWSGHFGNLGPLQIALERSQARRGVEDLIRGLTERRLDLLQRVHQGAMEGQLIGDLPPSMTPLPMLVRHPPNARSAAGGAKPCAA